MRIRLKTTIAGLGLILALCLIFTPGAVSQDKADKAGKSKKQTREICITFDELPVAQTFGEVDYPAVTYLLLEALRAHKVKAAGFVVGDNIKDNFDILGQWLNDGHTLGSMTYSNQDIDELGIQQFINDIKLGAEAIEPMLSGFGQKKRYFRYPYMHYGNTVEAKKQIGLYLDHMEYEVAHATVVPEDYLYNLSLQKLGKEPDSAEFDDLLNEYVNHVLDEVERAQLVAKKLTNRPVRQILRLRANRLNAIYLDEMLTALESEGYEFITLDRALQDDIFTHIEAYFGVKGVGYLDMIQLSDPDLMPAE